jgi:hypothetical protein
MGRSKVMFHRNRPEDMSIPELTARIREFIYDSQLPEAEEVVAYLGMSEISEEVLDKEYEESENRVSEISHLIPLLYAFAHTMAEGITEYQKADVDDEDILPASAWVMTRKVFTQVSVSTLVGALSQLVDLGIIKVVNRKGHWYDIFRR